MDMYLNVHFMTNSIIYYYLLVNGNFFFLINFKFKRKNSNIKYLCMYIFHENIFTY